MEWLLALPPALLVPLVDTIRLCGWLIVLAAIFIPLEQAFSVAPRSLFRRGFFSDLAWFFLGGFVTRFIVILQAALVLLVLGAFAPRSLHAWVAGLPFWLQFTGGIVVGEIGGYWGHRAMHEYPFLWRFHAIHHSAEQVDWLVNTRAHPIDLAFTRLCGFVPVYVLGFAQSSGHGPPLVPILYSIIGTIWGFFIHANLRWRLGWLEQLISTPYFHLWHHTNDGPAVRDKNYAAIFPWIDRLFGTLHMPRAERPEKCGIDAPMAPGFLGQLMWPFR